MMKLLVPVDDSGNSLQALRHVLAEYRRNPAIDIHLLNVQPPFSANVRRWIDRKTIDEAHVEASQQALQPSRLMLDEFRVPYSVHLAVGPKAESIAGFARELRCDHIVIGTGRRNSLMRAIAGSVTNELLELTTVPVTAVAGESPSVWERYGIPLGVGSGLAWLLVTAFE